MKIWRKIKTFLLLNSKKKWLFLEAFILLAWARVIKLLPFSRVASSLGNQNEETTKVLTANKEILKQISEVIHIMSGYTFWESQCLVKAIAAMKMLERRKIESTLYLGTGKDEKGKLIAHAWLRSGPFYISGSEGMERFAVVAMFAKRIGDNKSLGVNNE